jgi:hypothetical protein
MRALIGLAVIVYLVADLSASVMQPLPGALAWSAGHIAD